MRFVASALNTIQAVHNWLYAWRTVPVWNWIRASSLYKNGQFETAAAYYMKGMNRNHPAKIHALADAGFCYFKLNDLKKAEECLRKVIELDPAHASASMLLAKVLHRCGRACEAAQILRESFLHEEPDIERLGFFLYTVIEYDGPSYFIDEALKRSSNETRIGIDSSDLMQLAIAALLIKSKKFHRASLILDNAISKHSCAVEAFILKAELLMHRYEIEEAIHILQEGFAVDPNHPRALSLMAELYLKAGDTFNAEYAGQLALKACQNSAWRSVRELHVLAECYYHAGARAEALMLANSARELETRTYGSYKNTVHLERLIESLSVVETGY